MSIQVKHKGGSCVLVDVEKNREEYLGSIEPFTTVERLHVLQEFNTSNEPEDRVYKMREKYGLILKTGSRRDTRKIESKALSTRRSGYRMPSKSEKGESGKHDFPVRKLTEDKPHTQRMMEKPRMLKKEKDTYDIDELREVQELEAEIRTIKGEIQSKKMEGKRKQNADEMIARRHVNIESILGHKYKSGKEVYYAHKAGNVRIIDDTGTAY